jgi:hypothetical protein
VLEDKPRLEPKALGLCSICSQASPTTYSGNVDDDFISKNKAGMEITTR